MAKNMKLLQWNIRSLKPNKNMLERLLQKHNIAVAMLSETWINPNKQPPHIPGYSLISTNRADGKGGTAILVNKSTSFTTVPIHHQRNDDIQIAAINIHIHNRPTAIISLYCKPKHNLGTAFWSNIWNQVQPPVIIGGDFNSHHIAWGCETEDREGKSLMDSLDNNSFCILNDGSETLLRNPNFRKSVVDITLCSPSLSSFVQWMTLDDTCGSDHFPILIQIDGTNNTNIIAEPKNLWNISKANWTLYQQACTQAALTYSSTGNMNQDYGQFTGIIKQAANIAIPPNKTRIINPFRAKPWWDDDCKKIENTRKEAYDTYRKNMNWENLIIYKKISAQSRKLFKEKRRSNWKDFVASLNKDTPLKTIWYKIKCIDRGCSPNASVTNGPNHDTMENF